MRIPKVSSITERFFYLLLCIITLDASADPNCDTTLGRIAKVAVENAVLKNSNTACSGFKQGEIAIDKTRKLKLKAFELCENGPIVEARIEVYVQCGTSSAALIKATASDTFFAQASADLQTCTVSNPRVSASGFLTQIGLDWANVNQKLKEAAEREIKPYCAK